MRKLTLVEFLTVTLFLSLLFRAGSPTLLIAAEKAENGQKFTLCTARPALQTTVLRGYTRARRRRSLVCEESGRCLKVYGEMGDVVAADGLFAQIDTTFIDLEMKANRAACARLENQINYWHHEVERYRNLSGQKAVSEKKVLDIEQKFDQAELALAELKIKAKVLAERHRRCRITAPPDWRILKRQAEPGEWLTRGQVVAVVADYSSLLVPFSLTLNQYEWVKKSAADGKLQLTPEAAAEPGGAAEKISARLKHVSPAFNLKSRKIQVELELDRGLKEMRGGIAMELAVSMPEPGAVVAVPAGALVERYDSFWLIRPDGTELKVIKLGRTRDGLFKVTGEKLKPGDSFRCF